MRTSLPRTLVLFAVLAAACGAGQPASSDANTTDSPEVASETVAETSVGMEAVPIDQALSTAAAYFKAFNSGDANAVMALLPADTTFSDNFTESIRRESWEQRLVWNLAQGTTLATPDCTVPADGASDEGTAVRCESATLNAQIQVVGARPVPTVVNLFVTPNGIQDVVEEFGQPDFLHVTQPFMEWMQKKRPGDAEKVGFGVWDSIEQAQENGELTAEYVRDWAAYLELNCIYIPGLIDPGRDSYLDDCGFVEH